MNKKFEKIWELALPYLKQGKRKNFVIHTQGVVKAMELLLKKEKTDKNILIPAAILHDVGWSKVGLKLQLSDKQNEKIKALKLHLKHSIPITKKILTQTHYSQKEIEKIIDIILAHKFKNSRQFEKNY